MAEKKYVAVAPEDGTTSELVKMVNPANEFRGTLVSVNPSDKNELLDVRDLFVAHVKVDGKNIQAYTDNARRIVDISPHVELNPVTDDGDEPSFSDWECVPAYTPDGEVTEENPYPNKRISLRLRDDNKWVVVVVVQEADEEQGLEEETVDISCGKGGESSLELTWVNPQIDYGDMEKLIATRECINMLGYRLGVEDGLNEGKLLQPARGDAPISVKLMVNTTWSKLKNLRDTRRLQPGTQYRITDYVASTNGDNQSTCAGHPFDIIVVADDRNTLNEVARAAKPTGDAYFTLSDLDSWQVWYCLDNDANRFAWADPAGKGVVYRLIDEFGNDAPYDFKGIQFKSFGDDDGAWRYTFDGEEADTGNTRDLSLQGYSNGVYGNTIKPYIVSGQRKLNRIVFKGTTCHSNSFGNNCRNNTLGGDDPSVEQGTCCYNILGVENYENRFGFKCSSNQFGDYCSRNTFGYNCNSNKFGDTCSMNTFGYACKGNIFGIECQGVTFGNMCSNNKLGNACRGIYAGDLVAFCTFGSSIANFMFGNGWESENIRGGYQFVEVGNFVMNVLLDCAVPRTDPSRQLVKFVSIGTGVSGKSIQVPTFNQTHHTTYQMAGEETISI